MKKREYSELKEKYLKFAKEDGIDEQELKNIEFLLGVTLPDDFKVISNFFSGGCLGIIEHYSFVQGRWDNIVDETKRLRKSIGLPVEYIVLAEPPESLIVMDVEHKPSVIWCDADDVYNLKTKSYMSDPDIWDYYSDFFEEMLSYEEG